MFNVLYVDPAWSYNSKRSGGSMKSGAAQQYQTMSLEDICNLQINKICEKDSILFLWCTTPLLLTHAPKVLESWGFTYKTMLTWEKTGRLGMGYYLRGQTEHLIVAVKGKIKPPRTNIRNLVRTKYLKHSEKPEEVRQIIDQMISKIFTNPKKIELFARKKVKNWTCWGDQIDGKTIQQRMDERECFWEDSYTGNPDTNIVTNEVNDVGQCISANK